MPIIITIINWLLRLLDFYSIILIIYALMSWIPNLYETENQKDDGVNLRFPTYKQVYKMIRDDKDIEDVNIEE